MSEASITIAASEPIQLAKRVRHLGANVYSEADFARAFIRQALIEAADEIESGKQKPSNVELRTTIVVRISQNQDQGLARLESISPNPEDMDICYEICASSETSGGFWACYGSCNAAPDLGEFAEDFRQRRCRQLWSKIRVGKKSALLELIQSGCIDYSRIIAALEPLMTDVP